MTPVSALLSAVPAEALWIVLVLCRVSAAVVLLPGLGEADLPPSVRAGIAFSLTLLVAPAVLSDAVARGALPGLPGGAGPDASQILALAVAVVREVACGLFIGMAARIAVLALPIAAEFVTLMIGLTSVVQPDPDLGAQASALARMFSLAAPVLLLSTGLYVMPVAAIVDSYHVVSLGGALPLGDAATVIVRVAGASFACALRLAAPFIVAGAVWQICIGLLGRLVPHFQVGMMTVPGQLLGGLLLLATLSGVLLVTWAGMTTNMFSDMFAAFGG